MSAPFLGSWAANLEAKASEGMVETGAATELAAAAVAGAGLGFGLEMELEIRRERG